LNDLLRTKEKLIKSKKQSEIEATLQDLEKMAVFLKGINNKMNYMKIIPNCLTEIATQKMKKIIIYDQLIDKHKSIIQSSCTKIKEYEQSLELYS
jgi:hypothetical protein